VTTKHSAGRTLWRHADFLKLWTADTVSQLGTQITFLALPFTAISVLHANAFQVGLLSAMEFLPFILVGLPAGVWVDRLRRRPILIAGDLGRAVILGFVPLAYGLHVLKMWQLYPVAFLTGICTVFFDVAYQSYLPSLVRRDQIVEGNAKLETSRAGAQLAGPAVAGGLIQLVTAPVAILADAISYLWSASWVFLIRRPEPPVEAEVHGRRSMRRGIAEGLRYVWHHALLRPIAWCTATSNLFTSMLWAILVLFAVRELHMSAGLIGLALAIGNLGFLLGAIGARRIADRIGIGPAIIVSAAIFGPVNMLVPLATPSTGFAILVITSFVGGFFGMAVYNINQVSLRQAITPMRMQGRMNATMRFMVWGTMPIGALTGGVLGKAIGLRPTLWVAAIGGLFAFIPPLLSPLRSLQRIPEPAEDEPRHGSQALAAWDDGIVAEGRVPHAVEES